MTLEKLQSLPEPVLRQLAARLHILSVATMGREDLAEAVLEAMAEDREESATTSPRFWSELSKFDLEHDNIDLVDDEELRLPASYEATYLTVLQRDTSWFYVLWDYSTEFLNRWDLTPHSQMVLRIGRCRTGPKGEMKTDYSTRIRVKMGERHHYVNLLWREKSWCWAELCLMQSRSRPVLRSPSFSIFSPAVPAEHLSKRHRALLKLSALQLEEPPALQFERFLEVGER